MHRLLLLALVLLAGCQPPQKVEPATNQPSATVESELLTPATFANWPSVTEWPITIGSFQAAMCASSPTPQQVAERNAEQRKHGVHMDHAIIVRVSPDGAAAFKAGQPLPVGSVVVKEKYRDIAAKEPMVAYAVMTKRPAGYDPTGGDWEYAFVTLKPERKVTRGKLVECATCHVEAKERDFLFRSYSPVGR